MNAQVKRKLEHIGMLAHEDGKYTDLVKRCCSLEKKLNRLVDTLSTEQAALIWEFAMLSAEKSERKLEIACVHLEFISDIPEY